MCDTENETRKSSSSDSSNYQSVPDADREMAAQAFHEFEQKKYAQSLSSLKKLLSKRPLDSKVFHNSAVVEFYLSNSRKPADFNKKMVDICRQAHIDIHDLEALDDVDNCIVLYNQAVVLYHLHQYHSAICILDKVYQFIEPLEESLARNICFLFLECYLAVYNTKRANYVINYIETMIFGSSKSKSNQKDNQKEDDSASEAIKRKLQLCKARCYAMMKTSKACKREIKNLMSSGSQVQNLPVFYLKSQLEYQRGNYRKALKLLNSVTLPDDISKYFKETGDYLPAIFYNNVGCIHFYMGKPNMGAFYIEKGIHAFDTEIKSITGKLEPNETKLNMRPLPLMSVSTRHQLVHNLGMLFFQAQKFEKAFECFVQIVISYQANPRLWLRIAECCIHIQKPNCLDEYVKYKGRFFMRNLFSAGPHRKMILNTNTGAPAAVDYKASGRMEAPTLHFAMLCLKNALHLVKEYQYRSVQSEVEEEEEDQEYKPIPVLPSNTVTDCDSMYLRNSIIINCSYVALCIGDVKAAYEYAQMLLLQPVVNAAHKFFAHMYAGEAQLIMDKITDAIDHFTIDQFADPNKKIELTFSVENTSELSLKHQTRFDLKFIENMDGSRLVGNLPKWYPDFILTYHFVNQYNLAVAYAVREEWDKALDVLAQLRAKSSHAQEQTLSLMMYIHCHQGSNEMKNYMKSDNQPAKK